MRRPIILTDLDDTLFQTMRKCPEDLMGNLALMSTLEDGSPSGYATAAQLSFLAWLRHGTVVPVTARGRQVLARVAIEQAPAICANGGCIVLESGEIDRGWHEHLQEQSKGLDCVEAVYETLTKSIDPDIYRHWTVNEGDLALYITIKSNRGDDADADLTDIKSRLKDAIPSGWKTHQNSNNLAYMPPWLGKRHAAKRLIDVLRTRGEDGPIIGIGDSHSDTGFIDLCDFAMMPTRSQIWNEIKSRSEWVV